MMITAEATTAGQMQIVAQVQTHALQMSRNCRANAAPPVIGAQVVTDALKAVTESHKPFVQQLHTEAV